MHSRQGELNGRKGGKTISWVGHLERRLVFPLIILKCPRCHLSWSSHKKRSRHQVPRSLLHHHPCTNRSRWQKRVGLTPERNAGRIKKRYPAMETSNLKPWFMIDCGCYGCLAGFLKLLIGKKEGIDTTFTTLDLTQQLLLAEAVVLV